MASRFHRPYRVHRGDEFFGSGFGLGAPGFQVSGVRVWGCDKGFDLGCGLGRSVVSSPSPGT